MKGSEFVAFYAPKGLFAWEAAAASLAKTGDTIAWPWVDVPLSDGKGNTGVVRVQSDVFSVGTPDDFLRLPLTPSRAQEIGNVSGWLLPTPLLAFRIWQAASVKLQPIAMVPNKGAVLKQYAEHNTAIQTMMPPSASGLVAGVKKSVVVSNIYKPGKVVIFGWYRANGPNVMSNGLPMTDPNRQPLQPLSNVHAADYLDYSHGIHFVHPDCVVNGQPMSTAELYQHPTLSGLVSTEGPLRAPRYPASNTPAPSRPASVAVYPASQMVIPTTPGYADMGLDKVIGDYNAKRGS